MSDTSTELPPEVTDKNSTEPPINRNPPNPRPFLFTKGSVFVVNGSVYKVVAARPNGKITAKFMGVRR